jgi:2-phospho-L-lactate guanylyltransferase (CobY/MobA/RfbA family)
MAPPSLRCVLLFARTPGEEARAKRIGRARSLFALARRRVRDAAALAGADLVLVGTGPHALPQRGRTFGERLGNAFADARALGYREIVAVPTDVPSLGLRQIAEAFARLRGQETVLGPSPDGGVYLIGRRGDADALLLGVRWRTGFVLGDLQSNAQSNAGAAALLEPLADVDRLSDLRRLSGLDPRTTALVARLLHRPGHLRTGDLLPFDLLLASRLPARAPPPSTSPL